MDYRYWKEPESDSLMHYGVLGMRWGVRKANKEIKRAGKDLKHLVKKTAFNTYGSLKDERAKSYISKQNAIIDSAVASRKQKAKEALKANRGNPDVKANFVAKAEEKRNRKLMPESYKKHDKDYEDEIMLKNASALSMPLLVLSGGLVSAGVTTVASVPVINIVRFANRTKSRIKLDNSIKKMSIADISEIVNTYSARSYRGK